MHYYRESGEMEEWDTPERFALVLFNLQHKQY